MKIIGTADGEHASCWYVASFIAHVSREVDTGFDHVDVTIRK